jgi:hypothetical protein
MEKLLRLVLLCISVLFTQSCSIKMLQEQQTVIDENGKPYLGIAYSQSGLEKGLKITQILAGPFLQAIYGNTDIDFVNDRLIQINDISVSASNFNETIAKFKPGQTISLVFERKSSDLEKLTSINVTLANELDWTGPIKKLDLKKTTDIRYADLPDTSTENNIINFINDELYKSELKDEVNNIYDLFNQWQLNNQGFNSLSRVNFPFEHPDKFIELESHITRPLAELNKDTGKIFYEIAKNLDLQLPKLNSCLKKYSWDELNELVIQSNQLLHHAFKEIEQKRANSNNNDLHYLLTYIFGLSEEKTKPIKSLDALNMSMEVDFNSLLASSSMLHCLINNDINITISNKQKSASIPFQLKKAIKGKVKKINKENGLWFVYGSEDNNTYDMSMIDIVYDPDGNDTYLHKKPNAINLKLIIDKAGNDKYLSDDIGPATGWLGNSLLVDHQGNDIYNGKFAANGSGMLGIGILVDYAGKDNFKGDYFSNGAGIYGAGIIMDIGDEADIYDSASFSQGFGGPRGFGLIYEHKGNDLYRANRLKPSSYGTSAVYNSFSQGVGFGIRYYDSGGIGIIYDAHGSDRYEGGEFSQAGGYYWGLGIIHDDAGHDNYYGNRYSQGFAAHQATGILFDKEGNDNYWGMTAACQGAAWDVAMGFLIEIDGNDTYNGDGLCQGSAAMQAMGWLIDLNGTDHYKAKSKSAQGHSGNNTYHFNPENPVYSWSLLLDAGNDEDFYSNDRQNNQVIRNSEPNEKELEKSLIHGLFIDHENALNY